MLDFFFRNPIDPNYRTGIYESRDEIENTITQIRMTLLTRKGEVLGEPNFGFDATGYLFEFEGNSLDHIEKVADDIATKIIEKFDYNTRRFFIFGEKQNVKLYKLLC